MGSGIRLSRTNRFGNTVMSTRGEAQGRQVRVTPLFEKATAGTEYLESWLEVGMTLEGPG